MNFYAKNVFANFKIDFWCENETFGVNFKQDDATVMYYITPIWRCKLKQEKAPGQFSGGNISMDQVLTENNRMKMNESWPKE